MGALERLAAATQRWEAAQHRADYRWGGVVLGVVVGAALMLTPTPDGLSVEGQRAAAVAAVMALWWVGGVLPIALTALLPIVALPALGVGTLAQTTGRYFDPLNVLMFGGMVMGHAMERVGLHRRLVALLLAPQWVRTSPRRVLLAVMIATAALSCLMSNTATALMMTPLALTTAAIAVPDGRARTAFPLGIAYAASIGGVGTLIGTPPNAVLAGLAPTLIGETVTFAQWLAVGLPFVVLALPAAWWIVAAWTVRVPDVAAAPIVPPEREPWRPGERAVLAILAVALTAWVTRQPIDLGAVVLPGWGALFPGGLHDAWVGVAAALVLFLVPAGRGADGRPALLLSWREVDRAVPLSVLLLLGGGFAIAGALEDTAVTAWLARPFASLGALPAPVATLLLCAAMVFATELVSNTSATQIAVPLLAAAAIHADVAPLTWMIPATIAASCGFMMPAGTAPNAIATEVGGVSPADMAYAGVLVNVACVLLAALVALLVVPFVFG